MRNVWLITAREYRQRVRSRSFRIITAIGFLLILASAFAPSALDRIQSATGGSTVAVVGSTGDLSPALRAALPQKLPNGERETKVVPVDTREAAERGVEAGDYDGVLIARDSSGSETSYLYLAPQPDAQARLLREALGAMATQQRLQEDGLSRGQVSDALAPANLEVRATTDAVSGEDYAATFGIVYAFGFVLYLALIMYGNMVAMSVIGEKSTRITEIMTASVKPTEQMTGKLLGVGLLSLTQFAVWGGARVITALADALRGGGAGFLQIPPETLGLFGLFFALGFLLYSSLFAGLGALLSRVEDAGQLMAPFSTLLIAGFILTIYSMSNPDGLLSTVGSFIPFFAPMVLFARIELGDPALWQVALSLLILAASVCAAIWTSARLYRAGVLMYGKGPSLSGAMKLLRRS